MCGRYTRFAATELIYKHFGIPAPMPESPSAEAPPSWNVAPQSWQPVIRLNPITWQREMMLMRWGLVPFWILLANSIFLYWSEGGGIRTPDPLLPKQIRRVRVNH